MKGGVTGIWDPSMKPAHCGKSHFSLNPLITSFNSSPVGNNMCIGINFETMVLHVSWKIKHTVHLATPNSVILCSSSKDPATQCSIETGTLSLVVCLAWVDHTNKKRTSCSFWSFISNHVDQSYSWQYLPTMWKHPNYSWQHFCKTLVILRTSPLPSISTSSAAFPQTLGTTHLTNYSGRLHGKQQQIDNFHTCDCGTLLLHFSLVQLWV